MRNSNREIVVTKIEKIINPHIFRDGQDRHYDFKNKFTDSFESPDSLILYLNSEFAKYYIFKHEPMHKQIKVGFYDHLDKPNPKQPAKYSHVLTLEYSYDRKDVPTFNGLAEYGEHPGHRPFIMSLLILGTFAECYQHASVPIIIGTVVVDLLIYFWLKPNKIVKKPEIK